MRFTLAAVGKAKKGPEQELFNSYCSRLKWPLTLREVEEKRPVPVAERMAREAELLSSALPPQARLIVFDERGKNMDSQAFAQLLGDWQDDGVGDVALIIGGADGHHENLRQRADLLLSLGKLTWPHMLVRALIAEQVFRAQCILENHPYHRV